MLPLWQDVTGIGFADPFPLTVRPVIALPPQSIAQRGVVERETGTLGEACEDLVRESVGGAGAWAG